MNGERSVLRLLDNIAWHSLVGPHARFSEGTGGARRYARGFSPIVAFENVARPDFASLAACCDPGEHFYCDGWNRPAPDGWTIDEESTMFKMVWAAPSPDEDDATDAVPLDARHAPQALDLARRMRPGPFGPRTVELGDYFGLFEGDRLIAMAGERMVAGSLREISGVCTDPGFQGRGLARRLVRKLVRRQMQRGETPFLHVMRDNGQARELYKRMGFREYAESTVRVLSRHH